MRNNAIVILLAIGVAATAWTALTQIGSAERGVVLRFGRVIDVVGPGLHLGLPWGIDVVRRVDIDTRRHVTIGAIGGDDEGEEFAVSVPAGQFLTGDHNLVNIQIVLEYTVNESQVEKFILYEHQAEGLVARIGETVLAEWVAGRGVDEVLLRGQAVLPGWLQEETQRRLDVIDLHSLGILIHRASVSPPQPPPQVKDAFEAVNRAQADILNAEAKANQWADGHWKEALAYKFKLEGSAPVEAAGMKNLAKVEAAAFTNRLKMLAPIRKDNPYYLSSLWWDEMTRIYAAMRVSQRLDLLDNRLARDGLDIIQRPLLPGKK